MGLFKKLLRMNADPDGGLRGTAQIVPCTGYSGRGIYQNCFAELVVQSDTIEPTAVSWHGIVHRKRWPMPGMTLPVLIDPADATKVRFLWDEVERSDDRARSSAELLAAAMREQQRAGGPPA